MKRKLRNSVQKHVEIIITLSLLQHNWSGQPTKLAGVANQYNAPSVNGQKLRRNLEAIQERPRNKTHGAPEIHENAKSKYIQHEGVASNTRRLANHRGRCQKNAVFGDGRMWARYAHKNVVPEIVFVRRICRSNFGNARNDDNAGYN